MTTEKDAVRLDRRDSARLPTAAVPLIARIEPADAFADWLLGEPRDAARREPGADETRGRQRRIVRHGSNT